MKPGRKIKLSKSNAFIVFSVIFSYNWIGFYILAEKKVISYSFAAEVFGI